MKEIVPFFEDIFDIEKPIFGVGSEIGNQKILEIDNSKIVIGPEAPGEYSHFEIDSQEIIDQLVELYYSQKVDKIIFSKGFRISKLKHGNFYNIVIDSKYKDCIIEEMDCIENLTIDSAIKLDINIHGDPLDWNGRNPHNNCKMSFKNVKMHNINIYAHNTTYKPYKGLFFPCDDRCKFNLDILSIQTSHSTYDKLAKVADDSNQFMVYAKDVLKLGKNIIFRKFILKDCEKGYVGEGIFCKLKIRNWVPWKGTKIMTTI